MNPVRAECQSCFCLRLEEAISNQKPTEINKTEIKADPTTNFWTVYKRIADEHDDDLVSEYVGDLDSTLLFVSSYASLARLIRLNRVFLLY